MIVVKLGGSLMRSSKELVKEMISYSRSNGERILIVPGGSVFAETVRKVNASQEASHWMAILGMEQYGYFLADMTGAKLIEDLSITEGVCIILPYNLLKKRDELSHTWDVTSDSIAAWFAHQLRARFIKVTVVDGVYIDGTLIKEIEAGKLVGKETCLDAELPHFLMKNKMSCEVINGNYKDRLINALKGNVIGTLIKG
jgi:aspartokinase-like uncharacterized kinase